MKFLLDTNFCISILRGHSISSERLRSITPAECGVSVVTIYELRTGVEKCRRPNVELEKLVRFLEPFHVVPFNQDCANETARIRANLERRGKSIGPYDLLLAGQASAFQMTLITHNTGEFSRVEGLTIADWES